MNFGMNQTISPQQKMLNINKALGVSGIKGMQGTTRMIWDSLPVTDTRTFRFFESSNKRGFPETNLEKGNRLEVGESLVINFMNFNMFAFNETDGYSKFGSITDTLSDLSPFAMAELEILIANQRVMKPIRVANFLPQYNKNGSNETTENFYFDTQLIIPPLVEFEIQLRMPELIVLADYYMTCTVEGLGAIISTHKTL